MIIDGKHFRIPDGKDIESIREYFSFKTRKNATSSIIMIERNQGKIVYCSNGWPASCHDKWIFNHCVLFGDKTNKEQFHSKYGPIIADSGYYEKQAYDILCPIEQMHKKKNNKNNHSCWSGLEEDEKEWSYSVSAIEKDIERTFAQIFHQNWRLCTRVTTKWSNNTFEEQPTIILAACILHNLDIKLNNKSLLDGPKCIFD